MSLLLGFINFHVLREVYAIFFFYIELYEFSITSSREFYGRNTYVLVQMTTKEVVRQLGAIWGKDRGWSCAF